VHRHKEETVPDAMEAASREHDDGRICGRRHMAVANSTRASEWEPLPSLSLSPVVRFCFLFHSWWPRRRGGRNARRLNRIPASAPVHWAEPKERPRPCSQKKWNDPDPTLLPINSS
jgi:hypothetical protein